MANNPQSELFGCRWKFTNLNSIWSLLARLLQGVDLLLSVRSCKRVLGSDAEEDGGHLDPDAEEDGGCLNPDGEEDGGCLNPDGEEDGGCLNPDGEEDGRCLNPDGEEDGGCLNPDGEEDGGCLNPDGEEDGGCLDLDDGVCLDSNEVGGCQDRRVCCKITIANKQRYMYIYTMIRLPTGL